MRTSIVSWHFDPRIGTYEVDDDLYKKCHCHCTRSPARRLIEQRRGVSLYTYSCADIGVLVLLYGCKVFYMPNGRNPYPDRQVLKLKRSCIHGQDSSKPPEGPAGGPKPRHTTSLPKLKLEQSRASYLHTTTNTLTREVAQKWRSSNLASCLSPRISSI